MALSVKKNMALSALLEGKTISDAATQAGIGERTLKRWLSDDYSFRRSLRIAQDEIIASITRKLILLQEEAILSLSAIMRNGNSADSNKRLAADSLLSQANRSIERRDIEDRLQAIEKQ